MHTFDLKTSGELGEMQQVIFDAFKEHGDGTDLEISLLTKIPINCVTPRRGEFVEYGLLILEKKRGKKAVAA